MKCGTLLSGTCEIGEDSAVPIDRLKALARMPEWNKEINKRLAPFKLEPVREAEIVEELSQQMEDHFAESLAGGATPEKPIWRRSPS